MRVWLLIPLLWLSACQREEKVVKVPEPPPPAKDGYYIAEGNLPSPILYLKLETKGDKIYLDYVLRASCRSDLGKSMVRGQGAILAIEVSSAGAVPTRLQRYSELVMHTVIAENCPSNRVANSVIALDDNGLPLARVGYVDTEGDNPDESAQVRLLAADRATAYRRLSDPIAQFREFVYDRYLKFVGESGRSASNFFFDTYGI